ncbi:HAMP domain-containing sensor histidine kinase [Dactylosporangium sp. NPDC006015]|uniref:sensor histidine kinase n=1 Tax=Dactylosporangium sp. NPDC006015 TaxID=3154576 RepID=UPI0033BBE299
MRWRLALLVAAAMTLVLLAFLVPLALLLRGVAADRAVSVAMTQAQSLGILVATADPQSLRLAVEQLNVDPSRPVSVYQPDGAVVGPFTDQTPAVRLAARTGSFSVEHAAGREVLVAVQGLPQGTAVIRVFVPLAELRQGVTRAWLVLALLGAGLLAVGVAVADRLAVMVVRPIRSLAAVSDALAGGDLDRRAPASSGPPEVRAVAAALNHLAARIRHLLQSERERVADLSHRMRTPMTALRLDAEGLRDPADADRILAHVAALDRAVTTVIEDARRERDVPSCDATAVVAERVRFWTVLAEDQGRPVETDLPAGPLPVAVSATELAACVDALLGNVFAYTEEGVALAVTLDSRRVLTVQDAGAGFDPSAGARGVSNAGSTGLGLDIARRTAETAGGTLTVDRSPLGGARVTVTLGALTEP